MYATTHLAAGYDHSTGWSAGSRGYFSTDLYTTERYLVIKCLETLLYEKQKSLGMLNPYAIEYFPSTENRQQKDTAGNLTQEQTYHGKWAPNGKTSDDGNTQAPQNQINERQSKTDIEEWKTVLGLSIKMENNNIKPKQHKYVETQNRFSILDEDDDDESIEQSIDTCSTCSENAEDITMSNELDQKNNEPTKEDALKQMINHLEQKVISLENSLNELNRDYEYIVDLKDDAEEESRNLKAYYREKEQEWQWKESRWTQKTEISDKVEDDLEEIALGESTVKEDKSCMDAKRKRADRENQEKQELRYIDELNNNANALLHCKLMEEKAIVDKDRELVYYEFEKLSHTRNVTSAKEVQKLKVRVADLQRENDELETDMQQFIEINTIYEKRIEVLTEKANRKDERYKNRL